MQGASGAVLVGDATRADSIERLIELATAFEQERPGRPLVFALNKADLKHVVQQAHVESLSREFGSPALFTSAKTAHAVPTLFESLIVRIVARNL